MTTTETIREQSISVVECDIPARMTLRDYREGRPCRPASRWERTRVGMLGAGIVGRVAATWVARRSGR